ncbi:MAG: phosphoenolpyruvate--protein phosphotransferase [Phycisphaeraceae bacterium]
MPTLIGQPIAAGLAEGQASIYRPATLEGLPAYGITEAAVGEEHERLMVAWQAAMNELEEVRQRLSGEVGRDEAAVFEAHLAMLRDRQFIANIKHRVARDLANVEQALEREVREWERLMAEAENEYLRERSQDVRDVGRRVLHHLAQRGGVHPLHHLPPSSVIVACELLPSDVLEIDRRHVVAIITERGGGTSHAAILARSLGVPAVTGIEDACELIEDGTRLLVSGESGRVVVAPAPSEVRQFTHARHAYDQAIAAAEAAEGEPVRTCDRVSISLLANIARPEDLTATRVHHLEGVGLFRTEFLYLEAHNPPTLPQQRSAYSRVADALGGKPLVVRTFDLGHGKVPAFLTGTWRKRLEEGLHGLQFALREKHLLRTQLTAVVEASSEARDLRVLFPMVIGGDDLDAAIDLLGRIAEERGRKRPPVGAMIETPASLFVLEQILEQVDFLSIGTNDLTQFMLTTTREAPGGNGELASSHPAVLRAIAEIVRAARERNRPVTVCGEMAGHPLLACLLVGLGVRSLSMTPGRAARVRQMLRALDCGEADAMARRALAARSRGEVEVILREYLEPLRRRFAPREEPGAA